MHLYLFSKVIGIKVRGLTHIDLLYAPARNQWLDVRNQTAL